MVTHASACSAAAVTITALLAACAPPTPPLPHLQLRPAALATDAPAIHHALISGTCHNARLLCQTRQLDQPTLIILCGFPPRLGVLTIQRNHITNGAFITPAAVADNLATGLWRPCL